MTAWMASGRHAALVAVVLSSCPASWLWWPPKGSGNSGVYVRTNGNKSHVVVADAQRVYTGPIRTSKRLANRDKAAVLRVALSARSAKIDRLRAAAGAPSLTHNAEHHVRKHACEDTEAHSHGRREKPACWLDCRDASEDASEDASHAARQAQRVYEMLPVGL